MSVTRERLLELMEYNPDTGQFTRRVRCSNASAGSTAGCVHTSDDGYRCYVIRIDGRLYKAHRLAWLYMTGGWPDLDIDHKNTDGTDNRWENLRLATVSQNLCNRAVQSNNTSGFKGVSLHRASGRWMAYVKFEKRRKCLGYFDTPEAAAQAREKAATELHGDFWRAA